MAVKEQNFGRLFVFFDTKSTNRNIGDKISMSSGCGAVG